MSTDLPLAEHNPSWLRWWAAWRERRFAGRRCRELLALHHAVQQQHPTLTGLGLYRHIVGLRIGGDANSVDGVLQRAEESFASWPVSRPLNFRDVAHYLAVTEYFALHAGQQAMHADVKRVVDDTIPGDL